MAKGQLDVVLEHIRRPFQRRVLAELTDGQLLERFLGKREEGAFTALVERHAAMVMTAASRVIHDSHEAEDVFQATFLVLAKKASSIRQRRALAGWLYQVAYHLALKAKADKGQRHAQERRMVTMPQTLRNTNVNDDELRALLDQELSLLPEKYRTPLVLHYFEGKSKAETARQLNWTEGTVSGRLARARQLLRSRLVRRGFVFSSSGIATCLADNSAMAAVSPMLVSGTVDAALAFAQGITATGTVSASAASLANGMITRMLVTKIKMLIATVLLVMSVVGAGAGAVTVLAGQADEREPPRNPAENREARIDNGRPQTSSQQAVLKDENHTTPVRLSASGTVVDTQGKQIARATVYLREMALMRDPSELQKNNYTDVLSQTKTDAEGRFAFQNIVAEPMKISPSNLFRHPWSIVVAAKGYGVGWHVFKSDNEKNLRIVLSFEARLRGRLLDANGKPAASVRVQLTQINDQIDPDPRNQYYLTDWLDLLWSRVPLATLTDTEGRFTFEGLPYGFHIGLLASDPRFARKWLSCATIDKAEIERLNANPSVAAASKLLADGFSATLQPSGRFQGQIICKDTGKPAAGARVTFGFYSAVADSQGRYSLEGFDSQKYTLYVTPPEGADYLTISAEATASTAATERQWNFALERGSVITGMLREKETGKPLRVPYVSIDYQSERPTDDVCFARTKPDGSFRIVVPPGKGKLTTNDSVPGCVPRDLIGDPGSFPDPVSEAIEIKPGETLAGKDLLFLKGMVVQGRVLDEEGKPVVGAVFQGVTEQAPSGADGAFTLRGLSPKHNSIFHVVHAQRGLGVKITLPPSKDSRPVQADVQLRPTLSATGRVLDENKQPVANARISLEANITMTDNGQSSSFRPIPVYGPVERDSAGTYTLPTLVVGGSYTVGASAKGYAQVQASFKVEAGQKPQIADLVLLGNTLALAGVVVDAAGNTIKGVEVWILSRNQNPANIPRSMNTKSDGRFHFSVLPKGEYRLRATIWKPTGEKRADGLPDHKAVAEKEIRVEAGKENLRIVLEVPKE